jgi:hypothetical protein
MNYDITLLTFLHDPMVFHVEEDGICVRVPTTIASEDELVTFVKEGLGLPEYYGTYWQTLYEVLRDWPKSGTRGRRAIIVHNDLPLLHASKDGWFSLKNYLEILLDGITFFQTQNVNQPDSSKHRELVVIFPTQLRDELYATLTHPPVWQVSIGFPEYGIAGKFDASWPTVLRYLHTLDGLTTRLCTLEREDQGFMDIYYRKENATYFVEHYLQGHDEAKMASLEEDPSAFTGLPLDITEQVLETFYSQGEFSSAVHWLDTNALDMEQLEVMRGMRSYRTEGEALVHSNGGMIRDTIQEGMREAFIEHGEEVFTLDYWKEVLTQLDVDVDQRLAALCIIGISDLPEATELLRPFLKSSDKRVRWVSACLLGMRHDDEVVPILLSTLTDEMPFKREEGVEYDSTYDLWRPSTIRLLRLWFTPEIHDQLWDALTIWNKAVDEELLNPDYKVWLNTVKAIAETLFP